MCGIVLVKKRDGKHASNTVAKRYKKQKNRGMQGYGYVAVEEGRIIAIERAKTEAEILEKLSNETASEILFHHRQPTSTPNFIGATHPIIVSDARFKYDYVMIHNGVVLNCDVLKREHEKLDIVYTTAYELNKTIKRKKTETLTFANGYVEKDSVETEADEVTTEFGYNDSESLAWELALLCEGWQDTIGVRGGLATIFYQVNKDGKDGTLIGATIHQMHYGSNLGRPLVLEPQGKGDNKMVIIKSEGDGKDIDSDVLYSCNYSEGGVVRTKIKIGDYYQAIVNNVHNHGMGFNGQNDTDYRGRPMNSTQRKFDNYPDENGLPSNDYDEEACENERKLVEGLEAQEGKAWQEKAQKMLDEITGYEADLDSMARQLKDEPKNTNLKLEIQLWKTEIALKNEELCEVYDRLIELDLPIPSRYLPTIQS